MSGRRCALLAAVLLPLCLVPACTTSVGGTAIVPIYVPVVPGSVTATALDVPDGAEVMAVSPDGRELAVRGDAGRLCVLPTSDAGTPSTADCFADPALGENTNIVRFSPDSRTVMVVENVQISITARLWLISVGARDPILVTPPPDGAQTSEDQPPRFWVSTGWNDVTGALIALSGRPGGSYLLSEVDPADGAVRTIVTAADPDQSPSGPLVARGDTVVYTVAVPDRGVFPDLMVVGVAAKSRRDLGVVAPPSAGGDKARYFDDPLALSPDGRRAFLAVSPAPESVNTMGVEVDLQTGSATERAAGHPFAAAYSPDGGALLTLELGTGKGAELVLWSGGGARKLAATPTGLGVAPLGLRWSAGDVVTAQGAGRVLPGDGVGWVLGS